MIRPTLPGSLKSAVLRGLRCNCPRCGEAGLFAHYLKAEPRCQSCRQDWTLHQADDFPPYIAILVTGHVLAPLIIALSISDILPLWAELAVALGVAAVLMLAILQPAKGAVIALQWWMGMHGFRPAGRNEVELLSAAPDLS